MSAWYLDDGTLVGTRATLTAVLKELNSEATKALVLELNMQKCEIWWPTGDQTFAEFPGNVKRIPPEGVDILKIPVGPDAYVARRLQEKVADMERIVNKLGLIEDAQVEFTMLRACLGACRVLYCCERPTGTCIKRWNAS